MIIFPAIDLKDGKCVRLQKGDMDKVTIFNDNPAAQAKIFEEQGFSWVHIVDLNGAFAGKPVNIEPVKEILKSVKIPLQLGGGIRDIETAASWIESGIKRIIIGTAALKNPEFVKEACKKFPGKIAVGIDAKGGMVATEGWAETSSITVIELAKKFEDAGVAAIIYTDISRDGMLTGADVEGTKKLAEAISIPVIASGGISSNADIEAIRSIEKYGVEGVITGRALYDGRIDLKQLKM